MLWDPLTLAKYRSYANFHIYPGHRNSVFDRFTVFQEITYCIDMGIWNLHVLA